MRALILIAAVALASCGGDGPANNSAVQESSADEVTAANDATAIDAATGQAANMAADVNYTFNEAEFNELANALTNDAGNATANNSL